MENPYWHDEYKPHLVDREEIRRLCFEIDNIVTAGTTRQGSGIISDDPDDKDHRAGTLLDEQFYRMAESALSTRLLRLALLVRTFDDTMKMADDPAPYENHRKRIDDTLGPFGHVHEGPNDIGSTVRECSNKIIHAQDVRPTYETDDDRDDPNARWGMTGTIELRGVLKRKPWWISLHTEDYLEGVLELIQFGEEKPTPPSDPTG
jgi:hypothetical protein